ncbi:MAG: ATP-binding cassette domain-containing protein [Candidatus Omnitrophica bacterium]|nr:ATP-binding cassette domain-containing protein [Candidatus Omnitrophota bacterium]MCM8809050.1 ATP-binding cassette domain-containing protein [Candidatus Omnitrophota bacterium]MCM8811181.1 ATP-binding cassette domain-containing protein [Candidatus Omnitrophota bacterium]MCM8832585.1 ATP-binding cassette domain-containing protein [Candidatus Omnitrophota bacterium]
MLKIENISVKGGDSLILKDISLKINKNETMVIFGPNGSGKSTLLKSIIGISNYKIVKGRIFFNDIDITNLPISERAKIGIGIMFQNPPKIYGIKILQLARYISKNELEIKEIAEKLKVDMLLKRDLNVDLSGGEIKRVELFQILLQRPKLLLLDEPESGVDIENISIIGKVLNEYIKKTSCSALIITHTGYILDYIKGEKGCVIIDGRITCKTDPQTVFDMIKKYGYEKCEECKWR